MPEALSTRFVRHAALASANAAILSGWRYLFDSGSQIASPVAPTVALALSICTILGIRALPAILVGFLLSGYGSLQLALLIGFLCIYLSVYAAGSILLRRTARNPERWLESERSTVSFLAFAFLLPAFSTVASLLLTRILRPTAAPIFTLDNRMFLVLQWARESAGLLIFAPFLLVVAAPWMKRLFGDQPAPPSMSAGLREHSLELLLHTALSPLLLGLALWLKVNYALGATGFVMLPLLVAARHGTRFSSAALALSGTALIGAWLGLGWHNTLDPAGIRVLLLSGAVPVIMLAAVAEQRNQARLLAEHLLAQVRALAARSEAIGEDERRSICATISDDLRPGLIRLREQVAGALELLRQGRESNLRSSLESAAQSVDGVIQSVRRLATELRPGVLDTLGLDAAIEWLLHDFQVRSAIPCRTTRLDRIPSGRALSTLYFRLLQEVLRSVRSEGRTRQVSVALEYRSPDAVLTIDLDGGTARVDVVALSERVAGAGGELITFREFDGTVRMLEARVSCAEA